MAFQLNYENVYSLTAKMLNDLGYSYEKSLESIIQQGKLFDYFGSQPSQEMIDNRIQVVEVSAKEGWLRNTIYVPFYPLIEQNQTIDDFFNITLLQNDEIHSKFLQGCLKYKNSLSQLIR